MQKTRGLDIGLQAKEYKTQPAIGTLFAPDSAIAERSD